MSPSTRPSASLRPGAPSVAVVVTTYNGRADTMECLASLRADRVLLMDDASTDGTAEAVAARFPHVRVERNPANLGYARNVNRGIELSMDAAYVLILNNDVVAAPDLVERLITAAAADPRIAVCGPRMHYYARPELWASGARLSLWTARTRHLALDQPYDGDESVRDVDYMPGAAMLLSTDALRRVGTFDTSFEAYFEEVDFCCRVRAAGYRVVVAPAASIRHKVSRTMGGRRLPKLKFLMARNRLWTARRWVPGARLPFLSVADAVLTSAEFAKNLLVRGGAVARGIFRGWCAGWSPWAARERAPVT